MLKSLRLPVAGKGRQLTHVYMVCQDILIFTQQYLSHTYKNSRTLQKTYPNKSTTQLYSNNGIIKHLNLIWSDYITVM